MTITSADIRQFAAALAEEERSPATIQKYCCALRQFSAWLGEAPLTKHAVAAWKAALIESGRQPSTVNGKLTALDRWLDFCGRSACKASHLRLQRRAFCDTSRALSKSDYHRLIATAQARGQKRLALVIETLGATGMRVSELRHITPTAVHAGHATISLKGKSRTIFLPAQLCRKLAKYARRERIGEGPIFRTKSGRALSRQQIWAEMKTLCRCAGVNPACVFPHNLRHLFARTFYKAARNLAQLADVLGHTSIETTRLYLRTTSAEHTRLLDRLQLVTGTAPATQKRRPRRSAQRTRQHSP